MGLFDLFKKKEETQAGEASGDNSENNSANETIIDRNIFVKDPQNNATTDVDIENSTAWKRIFNRIRKDYEIEGYNDALSTADVKYRDDNKEILKLNLRIDIEEAEVEIKEYLKKDQESQFNILIANNTFNALFGKEKVAVTGRYRRQCPTLDELAFVVAADIPAIKPKFIT